MLLFARSVQCFFVKRCRNRFALFTKGILYGSGTLGAQRLEHIYRRTVTSLWCADLRPLHRLPNRNQHLPGNSHPLGSRRFRGLRPGHAFQNRVRHRNPEFVFHELSIAHADQRPDSRYHGNAAVFDPPQKVFQQANIKNRLRPAYSAPACTLNSNRRISSSRSVSPGFAPTPITKPVPAPIGFPPRSSPRFKLWTILTRPIASTSKTAVASG